jgi:hypothetical protein
MHNIYYAVKHTCLFDWGEKIATEAPSRRDMVMQTVDQLTYCVRRFQATATECALEYAQGR